MIDGGYVVTNAHVVWPFDQVRVVFPDGSEFLNAPVLNWDLMGDLAVIGPLQTAIDPIALLNRENLVIGSEVFLIGYPAEAEEFPQPAISRGLISRLREWEPIAMTYFQTDAAVAGGQSGGVLVSEDGEVIGITGLFFGEAQFGLVASAADVLPRVERLIAVEDVAGLGDRHIPLEGGQPEHELAFQYRWGGRNFVISEPIGTTIDIVIDSEATGWFYVVDMYGNALISVEEKLSRVESRAWTTELDAPYFLALAPNSDGLSHFRVKSNQNLIPFDDPDDGTSISIGQTIVGNMDIPGEVDAFIIELETGDMIDVTVDSNNFDPFVLAAYPDVKEEDVRSDDDSGGGVFGVNAKLTYRAPHSGIYFIVIADAFRSGVGGYFLTVAEAPPGATPTNPPPSPQPASETVESPFGPMALYQSKQYPFSIQYPADWAQQRADPALPITALFGHDDGGFFAIVEEDLIALGLGELTLGEYVGAVLDVMESTAPGF